MSGEARRAAATAPGAVAAAARWLREGGIVAYPTETFYGLAVDPGQPAAVEALYDLKGRDARSALPLVAGSRAAVERACGGLDAATARLADAAWPGPLAVVLAAPAGIAPAVHAGTGTIVVRVPGHPVARALAEAAGALVTATSANRSGAPPASTAAALDALAADPRVFLLDGGATPGGAPSTIVDARTRPARCLRAGAFAWSRVLELLHE